MSPFLLLFFGIALIFYIGMLTVQLLKIEQKLKDIYLYTERKVKHSIEKENNIDFGDF